MPPAFSTTPWGEPGPALAALLAHAAEDQRPRLLELRRDWLARLLPVDAAETAAVEAIVATIWRAEQLVALEARVTAELLAGKPTPGLPSLATLARLKARLEKERREAEHDLVELRRLRPKNLPVPALHPPQLEWLAARLREGKIRPPFRPAGAFDGTAAAAQRGPVGCEARQRAAPQPAEPAVRPETASTAASA